jgi:hypothetical protein
MLYEPDKLSHLIRDLKSTLPGARGPLIRCEQVQSPRRKSLLRIRAVPQWIILHFDWFQFSLRIDFKDNRVGIVVGSIKDGIYNISAAKLRLLFIWRILVVQDDLYLFYPDIQVS